jgi:hypothetical protein
VSPKLGRILWDLCFFFPLIFILRTALTLLSLLKTTINYSAPIRDIIWNLPENTFWLLWWFIGSATLWFVKNIGLQITNDIATTLLFLKDLAIFNEKRGDRTLWQIFSDPGFYDDVTIIQSPAYPHLGIQAERTVIRTNSHMFQTTRRCRRLINKGKRPLPIIKSNLMVLTQCINVDGASTPLSKGLDRAGFDMDVDKAWRSARESMGFRASLCGRALQLFGTKGQEASSRWFLR